MQELMQWPQWVVWRLDIKDGKTTKVPYSPHNGQLASVTDPRTWSTFEHARAYGEANGYNGVGFVLTQNDPFAFVDLDDAEGDVIIARRQIAIANAFNTYSERSPSQKGLHIVCKGSVPTGRRRAKVEVYSYGRYMTVTGDEYRNTTINDCNALLNSLWAELDDGKQSTTIVVQETPERYTDAEIYRQASEAANGDLFVDLWNGRIDAYGNDQSRADFALINLLQFYSQNIEQITRMFHTSALGQRKKAHRKDYLRNMIRRSFDRTLPEVDLTALRANLQQQAPTIEPPRRTVPTMQYTFPPGLLGEMASFFYAASTRPVVEISLAAAIGLMAGICGRAYNVSATGLNQYILVLAKTGTGKEAATSGIDKLMRRVQELCPAAAQFVGPEEIASGPALMKHLANQSSCFVSLLGEFGFLLQEMCKHGASSPEATKRRVLLKLYNRSGHTDTMREAIYSDKHNNTPVVKSPSFSLMGESTPDAFYANLDEFMIAQGLLPRFTCIDYPGGRVPYNKFHALQQPSENLIAGVTNLCVTALEMGRADVHRNNQVINVGMTPEAIAYLEQFDAECDAHINNAELDVTRQLWNRAHLKIMKLAALVAIGCDMYAPTIDLDAAQWAQRIIVHDVQITLARFESGKVGTDSSELNQVNEVADIVAEYMRAPLVKLQTYRVDPKMRDAGIITLTYIAQRLSQRSAFRHDPRGATVAIRRAVDALCNEGALRELSQRKMLEDYKRAAKAFAICDVARFSY